MCKTFPTAILLVTLLTSLLFSQEAEEPVAVPDAAPKAVEKAAADKPEEKKPDAAALYDSGRDALFQGDYKKAIELFQQAIAADKNGQSTTYQLNLARAYRYAGKSAESEKLLNDILKKSPDHVEAGQLLAELHYGDQQWQKVIDVLEPLLRYRHDYPTYHMLGEAAYNLDDYTKAAKYYEEAIRLNGAGALDHYQLGNIHLSENRYARAAAAYETALRLGLESPVLHYKLASSYFNLRNYFGGITVVTVAAGSPGTISGVWYLIERAPGEKDRFRAAPATSAIYQIAKALESDDAPQADIRMLRANTYLSARRYQRAHELYGELSELMADESQPDRALYHYYFAESALGLGKYDEYLSQLRKAIELDKETYASALVDAYETVAERYNQQGQLAKYIEYLKLSVEESPQTASLHLKLGHALEEAKEYGPAVQQWRMVLDLEPDHPDRTKLLNLIKKHLHTVQQAGVKAS